MIPYASGHRETAHYLIERGADVTVADRLGRTALHASVETNRLDLARALLAAGADVDAQFTDRVPALRGDYISRAPFKDATPFWIAARDSNVEMMRLLLEAGANPHQTNAYGSTPLMVAAGLGGSDARRPPDHRVFETVTLLLELGSDVAAATPSGQTALHGAASMWERTRSSSCSSTTAPMSTPRTDANARRSTWSSMAPRTPPPRARPRYCVASAPRSRSSISRLRREAASASSNLAGFSLFQRE